MSKQLQTQVKAVQRQSSPPTEARFLQRNCVYGQHTTVRNEYKEHSQKRGSTLKRSAVNTVPVDVTAPIFNEVLHQSNGQPLEAATRAFMESRFGHDFSRVRVHTDTKAAESAQAVNAHAYTVGQNVVFGEGQYSPGTVAGRRLLAHELTHTIQQGTDTQSVQGKLEVTDPKNNSEQEAERVASAVMQGQLVNPVLHDISHVARQMPESIPPSVASCAHPGESRIVQLQPIFFKSSEKDPSPTGKSWSRRFSQSNSIWGKLGVTFTEASPIVKVDWKKSFGKDRFEYDLIVEASGFSAAGVNVFLMDNDMTMFGGGGTVDGGNENAQVVMSDSGTSDTLLAHELGHVLGIDHPGQANPGDDGTIMKLAGSNSAVNPTRNTMGNYSRIKWPKPIASTCLHPDE